MIDYLNSDGQIKMKKDVIKAGTGLMGIPLILKVEACVSKKSILGNKIEFWAKNPKTSNNNQFFSELNIFWPILPFWIIDILGKLGKLGTKSRLCSKACVFSTAYCPEEIKLDTVENAEVFEKVFRSIWYFLDLCAIYILSHNTFYVFISLHQGNELEKTWFPSFQENQ